jgi:hypothetical protein
MHYSEPERFTAKADGVFVPINTMRQAAQRATTLLYEDPGTSKYNFLIAEEHSFEHERGTGGRRRHTVVLETSGLVMIMSVQYTSWVTYSDDSEDQGHPPRKTTYLVCDQPFSRKVFEQVCASKTPASTQPA